MAALLHHWGYLANIIRAPPSRLTIKQRLTHLIPTRTLPLHSKQPPLFRLSITIMAGVQEGKVRRISQTTTTKLRLYSIPNYHSKHWWPSRLLGLIHLIDPPLQELLCLICKPPRILSSLYVIEARVRWIWLEIRIKVLLVQDNRCLEMISSAEALSEEESFNSMSACPLLHKFKLLEALLSRRWSLGLFQEGLRKFLISLHNPSRLQTAPPLMTSTTIKAKADRIRPSCKSQGKNCQLVEVEVRAASTTRQVLMEAQ